MKYILTIILLLPSTISFGQSGKNTNVFKTTIELQQLDTITYEHLSHTYTRGRGGGYSFHFSADSQYRQSLQTCMTYTVTDSGRWHIRGNQLLLVNKARQVTSYHIYKTDSFFFFIAPGGKQRFLAELKKNLQKHKSTEPYDISGIKMTGITLACLDVRRRYYAYWIQYY